MSDPFLAEIRIFPGTFAPRGWALCNGQQMPLAQNTALFSLIGIIYGGDGRTYFNLPNLQGALPIQQGQGAGLSSYQIGQAGGAESVKLNGTQMPAHGHLLKGATLPAPNPAVGPANATFVRASEPNFYQSSNANLVALNSATLQSSGNSDAHPNLMPYLSLNFCIALQGIFPPRP